MVCSVSYFVSLLFLIRVCAAWRANPNVDCTLGILSSYLYGIRAVPDRNFQIDFNVIFVLDEVQLARVVPH